MIINFGREICNNLDIAESREWLVTNGIGGYASGTVAGLLTRRYHGLLIAALKPPLERTLLVTKLDENVVYNNQNFPLHTNRWADGSINPQGYLNVESFFLEGTIPAWNFALADALLEKRIWMQQGANTTYVQYTLKRASLPLNLSITALINYRDHHGDTHNDDWQMNVSRVTQGISVQANPNARVFNLLSNRASCTPAHDWFYHFDLAQERYRGLMDQENHLHAATFEITLTQGESVTFVASTEPHPELEGDNAIELRYEHDHHLLEQFRANLNTNKSNLTTITPWVEQLVLAADQFIVDRPTTDYPEGKTIIAGYPWFSDWGRDTMISLPGLTVATGRANIACSILLTFAHYVDQGMLPNRFPDGGEVPEYNTVDASLWYFEAIRSYYDKTADLELLQELFPVLVEIIHYYYNGTRFNIQVDKSDRLLYAGEEGVQLTWMDAKVGDWVVTPRIGKAIEINALWYNALNTMAYFAHKLGEEGQKYQTMAEDMVTGFARFWYQSEGYCYDVLDTPKGDDAAFRPNQIFAVSLPISPFSLVQQKSIVDLCSRMLLTSYGLRSLSPVDTQYQGYYGGDQQQRDGAYHQGTVWGWLLGAFVQAHLKVYQNKAIARYFLQPMENQLQNHGLGSLAEIFAGDIPFTPRGCIAQAWTVAEIIRLLDFLKYL